MALIYSGFIWHKLPELQISSAPQALIESALSGRLIVKGADVKGAVRLLASSQPPSLFEG